MFKVGDTVKVEGEFIVERIDDDGDVVLKDFRIDGGNGWVRPKFCTRIEPPLKVGDWVMYPNPPHETFDYLKRGRVDGIEGTRACVWLPNTARWETVQVSDLTRIEKP